MSFLSELFFSLPSKPSFVSVHGVGVGHVGFEGIAEVGGDKEPKGRLSPFRGAPTRGAGRSSLSGFVGPCSQRRLWGRPLPVQVESCDLSIVSLKVDEIEEVRGCLFVSLLSGEKGGIISWIQPWAGSLSRQPMGMAGSGTENSFYAPNGRTVDGTKDGRGSLG